MVLCLRKEEGEGEGGGNEVGRLEFIRLVLWFGRINLRKIKKASAHVQYLDS